MLSVHPAPPSLSVSLLAYTFLDYVFSEERQESEAHRRA